jgi:RNA polymerase sigma factor (sigma-70 family)
VTKFDFQDASKFSTYAVYSIQRAIWNAIYQQSSTVRLPESVRAEIRRVSRVQDELFVGTGRPASTDEVADAAHLKRLKVDRLQSLGCPPISLDAPNPDGGSGDDLLDSGDPEGHPLFAVELHRKLIDALAHLDDRTRHIVSWRFGLDGGDPRTFLEIADEIGLTSGCVQMIHTRALTQLRRLGGQGLRDYLTN